MHPVKRATLFAICLAASAGISFSQQTGGTGVPGAPAAAGAGATAFAGAPTGNCSSTQTAVDTTTGNYYSCNNGAWQKVGPGAGGPPTGTAGGGLAGTYPNPSLAAQAANTLLGNNAGSSAAPAALTVSQVATLLGLGTAANQPISAFDAAGAASSAQSASLQKASNLSDLASASTARTSLGLGSAATQPSTAFDASGAAATAQANAIAASAPAACTSGSYACAASPTFTGIPTAPTQAISTNNTDIATTAAVSAAIAGISSASSPVSSVFGRVGGVVPASGDYTVAQVTGAAPLASPTFTGTPTAPTQAISTNNTDIATTAAVSAAIAGISSASSPVSSVFGRVGGVVPASGDYTVAQVTGAAPLASPTFTGTPTAPTQAISTNNTDIATTAAVSAAIPNSLPPNGAAGGSLAGTYPNPGLATSYASFNVTAYGAKCDGATDDTAAFQSAITAASAVAVPATGSGALWGATPGTGALVVLPEGTCVTGPLTGATSVTFSGQGIFSTTWRLGNGSNASLVTYNNAPNGGVRNMSIDGNKANQTAGDAIDLLNNTQYATLDNLYIFNAYAYGVYVNKNSTSYAGEMIFDNLYIYQPGTSCIYFLAFDSKLSNIDCGFAGYDGIVLPGANVHLTNAKTWGSGKSGLGTGHYNINITGNFNQLSDVEVQDGYTTAGVYINGLDNICADCLFQNNGREGPSPNYGLEIAGGHGNFVTGTSTAISDVGPYQQYGLYIVSGVTGNSVRLTTDSNTLGLMSGTGAGNDIHIIDTSGTTVDTWVGGASFGNPTGGNEGAGTINVSTGYYINGTSVATSGANSNITSLSGLTTPLTIAQGGTGAASSAANTVFGNFTGGTAAPGFSATRVFSAASLTHFPTFNQNTTGSAGTVPRTGVTGGGANTVTAATSSAAPWTYSYAPAASTPAITLTGPAYSGGTSTTNYPTFYLDPGATQPTTLSTGGTHIGVNASSAFLGNFLDFRINGGSSLFNVASTGGLNAAGPVIFSAPGAASTPGLNITGAPYAGTNAFGQLAINWNTGTLPTASTSGTAFTEFAPSGFAGNLAQWFTGITSEFLVSATGAVTANNSMVAGGSIISQVANSGGLLAVKNSAASTSAACQPSGPAQFIGSYWAGSASAADTIGLTPTCVAGTNGAEVLTASNSGSTGQFTFAVTGNQTTSGQHSAATYATATNCSSAASPAVCSAAAAGSVAVASGGSTLVVNTTAVTANSQITLTFDSSQGTRLGVTCNTTINQPSVSARTAGTSFTITMSGSITTNPDCIDYTIMN